MVRPVVVHVKQGWLQGSKTTSETGVSIISFKGIPYAAPPIDDLRFREPQPLQSWTGMKEALEERPQCIQLDIISKKIEGKEDCLYLNVSTQSLENGKGLRPVMVWIHGGGFMWGNGGTGFYGPDYLVEKDIVFVSLNYRLGVFGFLSLDHEAVAGNMGLKDQVAALRWVKENISQFGGDPNNVTIFGESAGSASVHYHLLSPLSKGLFHKAIAQSGVAVNPWTRAFQTVEIAHRLVAKLGKETQDPIEIVEHLRKKDAHILAEAQHQLLSPLEMALYGYPFAPTVDSESKRPFLPRTAHELIAKSHDVPLMLGYNSHEGTIALLGFTEQAYPIIDEYFDVLVSRAVFDSPLSAIPGATKKIRNFYFGDKKITKDALDEYIKCMGDYHFVVGIHDVVESRANNKTKSPTYLYRFGHDGKQKLSKILVNPGIKGAGHFDDIAYLFRPALFADTPFIEPGSIEQKISERFVRMWTDFAKIGNPTPRLDDLITVKWKPVTSTTKNYLSIGKILTADVNPNEDMWQFWKSFRDAVDDI